MKLLDVNVLVASFREDHEHHEVVSRWWSSMVETGERFVVPDAVAAGFVRVVTNRRIFREPTPLSEAFGFLARVIAHSSYRRVVAGPRHPGLFEQVCIGAQASGNLVTDAYLAAIALEHDCELVSMDRDFARFEGLRWFRPSEPSQP